MFGVGFGFAVGFGFDFAVCFDVTGGFGVVVGGVTGAVTSVDASSVLFAPFVSLPSPVPGRRVDVRPGLGHPRRESDHPLHPGPQCPEAALQQNATCDRAAAGDRLLRHRQERDPAGAASVRTTLCAWFGPLLRTRIV